MHPVRTKEDASQCAARLTPSILAHLTPLYTETRHAIIEALTQAFESGYHRGCIDASLGIEKDQQ